MVPPGKKSLELKDNSTHSYSKAEGEPEPAPKSPLSPGSPQVYVRSEAGPGLMLPDQQMGLPNTKSGHPSISHFHAGP